MAISTNLLLTMKWLKEVVNVLRQLEDVRVETVV